MPLPLPVLDHVVVNVRDGLDDAATLWERLGFMLTPRGHHTLGSSNHLAVFGGDYLELLGVQPGNARTDVLDWPVGLNGLVFKTYDADAAYLGLHAAGVPALPVQAFSRPVETPGGAQDAAFRTVRIERDATPAGRMFFCQHLTPALVWDGAWQRHSNGALGIARVVVAADDPAGPATLLSRMFGWNAVPPRDHGASMAAGLARVDIMSPHALQAEFGGAAPAADGRKAWMAALTLRTASLASAAAVLAASRIPHTHGPAGIVVPASELGGTTLVFQD